MPYWVARKVLHVVAVSACAYAVLVLDRPLLIALVVVAEAVLVYLVATKHLMVEESGRPAWGIAWFPLAYLTLLVLEPDGYLVAYAMTILAVCDPIATVVGKLSNWRPYELTGDRKTLGGSIACGVAYVVVTIGFVSTDAANDNLLALFDLLPLYFPLALAVMACSASVVATTEALGSRGLDNLFLPIVAYALYQPTSWITQELIWLSLPLMIGTYMFTKWSVRRGSLTTGGALTAGVLAAVIVYTVGSVWLLPLVIFFGSSTLIGKYLKSSVSVGDEKHAQPRDATQVLANGGLYGFVAIFGGLLFRNHSPLIGYFTCFGPGPLPILQSMSLLTIMAIATADTWSSEVGQYFGQATYDVTKFRKVSPGLSGGISVTGSLAGLLGSLLIGLLALAMPTYFTAIDVLTVTAFGFLGMLIDSILGSLLQVKYKHPGTGIISDARLPGSRLWRGYENMTNDAVNALAIFLGWLCLLALTLIV